jgi:hypothetical protein
MFRWSCALAVLLVVGAVGCDGGAKPLPGAGCVMNSDCHNPLSCTYGKCHVMCDEARDCDPGQLCAGPPGAGVCLLLDEQECGLNSDCPEGLFCAIDLTCRTQCENERDCTTGTQQCVPSVNDLNIKVCAEPPELEGDMLKPAPPPDAGASSDAGSSSDTGTDPSDASGSDAGADGAVGPAPDGGQSVDAGDVVGEIEPNEDRDHATPYTPGSTVTGWVSSAEDIDFYEVVVPASDLAGGYYQASITDVGEGSVRAIVYTASDNKIIHQAPGSNGASLFFYWAAAPEQKYRIEVTRAGNFVAPYDYTLKIQYTRINDTFEPNDTSVGDAPKLVTLGMPITAYFFTGFKEMTINAADYEDWFLLDLAAGMTTVKVDTVATDARLMFEMIDSGGNPVSAARKVASAAEATIDHSFMVTTAGKYRAVIRGYANQSIDEADNAMMVPGNFTNPYTLTVSQ